MVRTTGKYYHTSLNCFINYYFNKIPTLLPEKDTAVPWVRDKTSALKTALSRSNLTSSNFLGEHTGSALAAEVLLVLGLVLVGGGKLFVPTVTGRKLKSIYQKKEKGLSLRT